MSDFRKCTVYLGTVMTKELQNTAHAFDFRHTFNGGYPHRYFLSPEFSLEGNISSLKQTVPFPFYDLNRCSLKHFHCQSTD